MPAKTREPDDLAGIGGEVDGVGTGVRLLTSRAGRLASRARTTLPIAATSESMENSAALRSATTLPSFITTTRSAVESTSPRMCEMKTTAPPPATKRRT
jgi:hypothetical protein